jgi:YggT family protein
MHLIGNLLHLALQIYFWIIIIQVAVSWLIAFGVVNTNSPQAQNLLKLLDRATDPVYKPLRKFIPPLGGIDVTPIVVIVGIALLQKAVISIFY